MNNKIDLSLPVLSIQQPWAFAILKMGKDIENRSWPTHVRGRILIHAGKKIDTSAAIMFERQGTMVEGDCSQLGGIVGSVEIVGCVDQSDSMWFYGPYGFVLRDPQPLPFYPCRGQLGFFRVGGK